MRLHALTPDAAEFGDPNPPTEAFERKPADFRETFAGNTDDSFRLGIKFTRSTIKVRFAFGLCHDNVFGAQRERLQLFTDFYQSDLIIASPLGLRLVTESGVVETKEEVDPLLGSCAFRLPLLGCCLNRSLEIVRFGAQAQEAKEARRWRPRLSLVGRNGLSRAAVCVDARA